MIRVKHLGVEKILNIKTIGDLKDEVVELLIVPNRQYAIATDAPASESKVTSPIYYEDPTSGITYYFFQGKVGSYKHNMSVVDMPLDYTYYYVAKKDTSFPLSKKILTLLYGKTDAKEFTLPTFDATTLMKTTLQEGVDEKKVATTILDAYADHITYFDYKIYIYPSSISAAASLFSDDYPIWHELTEEVADRLVHHFEPNASSSQRNEVIKFIYLELSKRTTSHVYNPDWVLFANNTVYNTNPNATPRVFPYDPKTQFFTRMVPVNYLGDDALDKLKPSSSLLALLSALSTRKKNPESRQSKLIKTDMMAYVGLLLTDKKYDITLFLTGTGGNGKSQFVKFVTRLIPSSQVVSANNLTSESAYQTIASKRLLILEEINKLDRNQEGQVIDSYKNISGSDTLSFRKFYTHNVIDVKHRVQFVITANTIVPGFYAEESTIRRFKVVNSEEKVKEVAKEFGYYIGESVTDVADSIETEANLTWYANYAVRTLIEFYSDSKPKLGPSHTATPMIPQRPVEKMFEPDTSIFIANKHHLVAKLLKGLKNAKIIPNMYDFDILRYTYSPTDTSWNAGMLQKFISTLTKYTPEKIFELYATGSSADSFQLDPDQMNKALSILFERVITPKNAFKLSGNSLYDEHGKIYIKDPRVQRAYDEARGVLSIPPELTYEALMDFKSIRRAPAEERWTLLEKRKNDIVRSKSYHTELHYLKLTHTFQDIYDEVMDDYATTLEKIDDFPETIAEYATEEETTLTVKSRVKKLVPKK